MPCVAATSDGAPSPILRVCTGVKFLDAAGNEQRLVGVTIDDQSEDRDGEKVSGGRDGAVRQAERSDEQSRLLLR